MTQQPRGSQFWDDSAESPCLDLGGTGGLRISSSSLFFGSGWHRSTETFCSNLVQMLWACHCLFSFFSKRCLFRCCLRLFHPSVSPLAMSQHLLSYLLFDSWHAERCQPITVTRCYLYLFKTGEALQFSSCSAQFISHCFWLYLFLILNIARRAGWWGFFNVFVRREALYQ